MNRFSVKKKQKPESIIIDTDINMDVPTDYLSLMDTLKKKCVKNLDDLGWAKLLFDILKHQTDSTLTPQDYAAELKKMMKGDVS